MQLKKQEYLMYFSNSDMLSLEFNHDKSLICVNNAISQTTGIGYILPMSGYLDVSENLRSMLFEANILNVYNWIEIPGLYNAEQSYFRTVDIKRSSDAIAYLKRMASLLNLSIDIQPDILKLVRKLSDMDVNIY